jgi:hypothetical protein
MRIAPELFLPLLEQEIEGAHHVGRGERLAIVPLHALAQDEGELLAVVAPLPARGEVGNDRLEAVSRDFLVEDDEIVVERHERHDHRDRRFFVDRGTGRRVHVLDLQDAAGFLGETRKRNNAQRCR